MCVSEGQILAIKEEISQLSLLARLHEYASSAGPTRLTVGGFRFPGDCQGIALLLNWRCTSPIQDLSAGHLVAVVGSQAASANHFNKAPAS
jgi:hypothetical protein